MLRPGDRVVGGEAAAVSTERACALADAWDRYVRAILSVEDEETATELAWHCAPRSVYWPAREPDPMPSLPADLGVPVQDYMAIVDEATQGAASSAGAACAS